MSISSSTSPLCEDESYYYNISYQLFPGCSIQLLANQGACSTTFALQYTLDESVHHRILQFRQPAFELDIELVAEAKFCYGEYVPATRRHAMPSYPRCNETIPSAVCYEMEVIMGTPFQCISPSGPTLSHPERKRQENLVRDFADFVSRGWPNTINERLTSNGKVGLQVSRKLKLLSEQLPLRHHREVARKAMEDYESVSRLPVVITHGDTIPSNMMCDSETGRLTGVVDWAEAEYLPFGFCFYGLEHLLGRRASSARRDSMVHNPPFVYYNCAADLRRLFWQDLISKIPALLDSEDLTRIVVVAKTVGTLLWYGFAWDGGAIDRVVNAQRDVEELVYLDAFLDETRDSASLSQVLR